MSQDRFSNTKYVDWVKEQVCLTYAKEGLESITERQVQNFHTHLRSRLQAPSSSSASAGPTLCHTCSKADQKRQWSRQRFSCANGICDGWLDLLQQNHVYPTSQVVWDNFDVSKLPVSAWECAKVYLPYGGRNVQCAADADLTAILTLYLNCRHFASCLTDVTLCKKVKMVRKRLIHSDTMEVDHDQMLSDVGVIKQLLNDQAFAADTSCQEAITKIDQLVRHKPELSQIKKFERDVNTNYINNIGVETDQLRQDVDNIPYLIQPQYRQMRTVNIRLMKENGVYDLQDKIKVFLKKVAVMQYLVQTMDNLTDEIQHQCPQLRTDLSGLTKELSNLKDRINVSTKDIVEDAPAICQASDGEESVYMQALKDDDDEAPLQQIVNRVIPTQRDLEYAYRAKDAKTFEKIANIARSYILSQSSLIKKVKVAYLSSSSTAKKEREIVFIAFTKTFDKISIPTLPYTTLFRKMNHYSSEGEEVMDSKASRGKPFTKEESASITKALKEHSEKLMKEHSNVRVISACSVKSKNFGTDNAMIIPTTCIVIYVDIKGLIPVNELPLPTDLNDIPVDVREGGPISLGDTCKGPNEKHTDLRMGCQISTELNFAGTLGVFVEEIPSNTLYFLTCAHVVLEQKELDEMQQNGTPITNPSFKGRKVYQPRATTPLYCIGSVEKVVHKAGGGDDAGVDIALIKVEWRPPRTGEFPAGDFESAGFDADRPMTYTSGKAYEKMPDIFTIGSELIKFGAVTGPTRGNLCVAGTSIKRISEYMDTGICLFNQYEVMSRVSNRIHPFAEMGDSGALVFIPHKGDCSDLRAVGILLGATSYKTIIITPIWEVLKALKMPLRLKTFEPSVQKASLESTMDTSQALVKKEVEDRIESLKKELLEDADRRDQAKSQELAEQNLATQTRMNDLEQKIDKQHKEQQDEFKSLKELILKSQRKLE